MATEYDPTQKASSGIRRSGPTPIHVPPEVAAATPADRFGKFIRTAKLGAGGMGEVWKAWDSELRRWVALKFLKGGDDSEIARFLREAQTAAKLVHPHIAAIYEAGQSQGRHYIAMQYVEGRTLRDIPRTDAKVPVGLLRDAAKAVHFAHREGVIHRDIKPDNLMVGKDGHVFVMDFGLARSTEGASEASVSGAIVGTPSFMPPEQARGEKIDARSDVYALGATLYQLLTGRPPFRGANVYDTLRMVADDEAARPRTINPRIHADLETMVLKCLEKDPARRYRTAGEVAEELTRWLNGEAILAHPPSTGYRLRKFMVRRRAVMIPTAIALVLAIVFGSWLVIQKAGASSRLASSLADARRQEREGRLEAARDAWKSVLGLDAENGEALEGVRRTESRLKVEQQAVQSRLDEAAAEKEALRKLELARPVLDRAAAAIYRAKPDFDGMGQQIKGTVALIEAAIRSVPNLAQGPFLLGRAEEYLGRIDLAEQHWRRAIELDPRHAGALSSLGRLLLIRGFMEGTAATEAEAMANAEKALNLVREGGVLIERAIAIDHGFDDPIRLEVARAMVTMARKDRAATDLILMSALQRYGDKEGAEDLLWMASCSTGNLKEKQTLLQRALDICPNHFLSLVARSGIREKQQEYLAALEDLRSAVLINPGHKAVWVNLASLYDQVGDLDGALEMLDTAVQLDPKWPAAHLARVHVFRKKGDIPNQINALDRVLELMPKDPDLLVQRGIAKKQAGDVDGAMEDYDRCIRVSPGFFAAYFNRGLLHEIRGDRARALGDFQEVLRLAPSDWPHRAKAEAKIDGLK